jgi:hypothetical protein
MNLDYSPNVLDTPSLTTPIIHEHSLLFRQPLKLSDDTPHRTIINHFLHTNPVSHKTITNNESLHTPSSEDNISKIKNHLTQDFTQPRQPTESPFFPKSVSTNNSMINRNLHVQTINSDETHPDLPSTAEVVKK